MEELDKFLYKESKTKRLKNFIKELYNPINVLVGIGGAGLVSGMAYTYGLIDGIRNGIEISKLYFHAGRFAGNAWPVGYAAFWLIGYRIKKMISSLLK